MMLATMSFAALGIIALLAIAAMIGTWQQYGSAWNVLDVERSSVKALPVCCVAVRADALSRAGALVPVVQLRAAPPVVQPWNVLRAAA